MLDLTPGRYTLGRGKETDFPIDDPTVSSAHCEVTVTGNAIIVKDLGSTNGTTINGQPITEAELKEDQLLKVGDVEVVLERVAPVSVPQVDFAEAPPPPPLPDGSQACLYHAGVAASFICPQCQKFFCPSCVRKLRRAGGELMVLCPICSTHCELIPGKAPKRKKRSIFGRLRRTLKLPFGRR